MRELEVMAVNLHDVEGVVHGQRFFVDLDFIWGKAGE